MLSDWDNSDYVPLQSSWIESVYKYLGDYHAYVGCFVSHRAFSGGEVSEAGPGVQLDVIVG